jgi:hypothetical protein
VRPLLRLLPLLSLLLVGRPARAQETAPAPTPPWSEGTPRPFLAGQAEGGSNLHLRAIAGWGQPWWLWGGLIADGWLTPNMAYGGVGGRANLLLANLDVRWRTTRSFDRRPMTPAPRHAEVPGGGPTTLHAWDLDLWGVLPTPGGFLQWEGQATRLLGAGRDVHLYDEVVQAIVRPPWAGMASVGWVADLCGGALQIGASAEVAFLGRGDARRWRAGPQLSWTITPRWTLRGQALVTVAGPDALGFGTGLGGGLVLGWRTATGAALAR